MRFDVAQTSKAFRRTVIGSCRGATPQSGVALASIQVGGFNYELKPETHRQVALRFLSAGLCPAPPCFPLECALRISLPKTASATCRCTGSVRRFGPANSN